MTLHPDMWLVKVGDHEIQHIPVTQFDNAKCNVRLDNVTGKAKARTRSKRL